MSAFSEDELSYLLGEPVGGAMMIEARLLDGTVEEKIYAPRYGEFRARVASVDELYQVALAVPRDQLGGPVPADLSAISNGATNVFGSATSKRWDRVSATVNKMAAAWQSYRAHGVPPLLDAQMSSALDALAAAVASRVPATVRQGALDVARAGLDLQLQYRGPDDIDEARLQTWRLQLVIDRAGGDSAAVAGDRATLQAIEDRID